MERFLLTYHNAYQDFYKFFTTEEALLNYIEKIIKNGFEINKAYEFFNVKEISIRR